MLDRVTHRKALRDEFITILRMLMGLSPAVMGELMKAGLIRKVYRERVVNPAGVSGRGEERRRIGLDSCRGRGKGRAHGRSNDP